MIAVTFALPNESRDFLRLLARVQEKIVILYTGVGADICQSRLEPFLDQHRFEFLLSSGFAGGVDPSIQVGDIVLAENFSAPDLLERAEEILEARAGKLLTAGRILMTASERESFSREQHALAVDMETEVIAQACAKRSLPMLSLRAISDTAAKPFPAPPEVLFDLQRQKTNFPRLALYLLAHPGAIVRLQRFARQIAFARQQLAAALEIFLRSLD